MTSAESLAESLRIDKDEAEEIFALIGWASLQRTMRIHFDMKRADGGFGYIEVEAFRELQDCMRYPVQIIGRGGEWLWALYRVLTEHYVDGSPDVKLKVQEFVERAGRAKPGKIAAYWGEMPESIK